jgi:lactate dehydrogenase-like 2-hydroxyacid dehydrogenase
VAGPKAVLVIPLDPAAMARIEAESTPVVCARAAREDLLREIADAEGLLCPAPFPVGPDLLDAAPRLRVISNYGVGYNNVDLADLTRRGIVVCNTPGVLSAAVADLTMLLILAAAKRFLPNELHARSAWGKAPPPPLGFDLLGKTLGIVGLGRIGKTVVPRARAFGMEVIFHDLFQDSGALAVPYRPLDDLLRESDIVTLHTNLTADSHHLIGARELGLMKPTAWLVNTSRGPVVDEGALVEALKAGTIAGAALDVIEVEPPPEGAPILSAPNTILLPHIGTATVETRAAMLDLCIRNLLAVLNRRQPPECVNPEALERALTR